MTATTATAAPALDASVLKVIQSLTAKGRETMTAVGDWNGSFFDEGCVVGSGIWGECLMNESGHQSMGVINRLRDLGLFGSTEDPESGSWFYLTDLGVAVAQHLNTTTKENDMTETTTAKPAATAAKKATAAPAKKVRAYKVPKGYEVKWQHGGHDLLRKADADAKGPAWYTACNEHGDLAEAATAKEAEGLGVLKVRATWCKGDHAAKPAAAKKAPAKGAAAKKAPAAKKATPAKKTAEAK